MADYWFNFYYIDPDWKAHPLADFYNRLMPRIYMHESHIEQTSALYQKEKQTALNTLAQELKADYEAAQKAYGKHKIKTEEDDQYAYYESGLQQIADYNASQQEEISIRFSEMEDNFNKSSLIALYALLEKEMHASCDVLQSVFAKKLSYADMNYRNYLMGGLVYIQKVIELPYERLEPYENKFTNLQHVRNFLVHTKRQPGKEDKGLHTAILASQKMLIPDSESGFIMPGVQYLLDGYNMIKAFFTQAIQLSDILLDNAIIKNWLRFIFKEKDRDVLRAFYRNKDRMNFQLMVPHLSNEASELHFNLDVDLKSKTPKIIIDDFASDNPDINDFIDHLRATPRTIWEQLIQIYTSDVSRLRIRISPTIKMTNSDVE